MGNTVQGKRTFSVDGETFTLQFTPNAFCELEDASGLSTSVFLAQFQANLERKRHRMKEIRMLFWAGLTEHHDTITEKQAGRMMQELGGVLGALEIMHEALGLAFPDSGENVGKETPAPLAR
ncbi:GTA-gp10 family protein [Pseudooceanicola algae]|uniref:Gene transfer agent protein n=1 Tax=Pseudooceanicola algae TaxID=1537215 RepID=A0A418SDB9_9RHOB|nr:GTA-gp10 family protein [Pseudooceanicola algae]QPM89383.1 hypothetical protein PSAL_005990 [Pseudooceanicola algae]